MAVMRLAAAALAAALVGGRAEASAAEGPATVRVRCLLIAPLENASDVPDAAGAADEALFASAGASRGKALPERDLRAIFAGSPMELPQGLSPSVAMDLAGVLGADGVLYGSVEGSGRGEEPTLAVTLHLAGGSRELIRAATARVARGPGETTLAAVRRAATETGEGVLSPVGGPPLPGCFDPERLARVRELALAARKARPEAPAPPAPPFAAPATARQAEWSWRLGAKERFVLEGVSFEGRSARIARASGLEDLAGALRASPSARIRIEGFVDASGQADGDARLSLAMAQAVAERLVALGIPRERLTWTGRGSDAPLLPNFTARGRARNRRIEVVALPETASRP